MGTILASVPSKTTAGKSYNIVQGADGVVYCQCPAWKYQRLTPSRRTCKHLLGLLTQMKRHEGAVSFKKVG